MASLTHPDVEEWLAATFETSLVAMGIISTLENRYVRANASFASSMACRSKRS